jgi:hypothetical protein
MSSVSIRTTSDQTENLHKKYYPIISVAPFLTMKGPILIDYTPTNASGRRYIKYAIAHYLSSIDTTITCSYFIDSEKFGDSFDVAQDIQDTDGLSRDTDVTMLYFKCSIIAPQDWFSEF